MKNNTPVVGRFVLDSLTIGMYKDPKVIYREYIQNSTDGIDCAVKLGILANIKQGRIEIEINKQKQRIVIYDNGSGISSSEAYSVLTDIGNSKKIYTDNRGFRGIGRLGGLSYCEKLIFETSFKGENSKSRLEWNASELKKQLLPGDDNNFDVIKVIDLITKFDILEENSEAHYFKVTMEGVKNGSELLEEDIISEYLQQVAPIPFDAVKFPFYSDVKDGIKVKLAELGKPLEEYRIFINSDPNEIVKPYKMRFKAGGKDDEIKGVHYFYEKDKNESLIFWGWYADTNYYGTVSEDNLRGIRIRKGNILIGTQDNFEQYFKGSNKRLNGWNIGEIYIYGNKLIPNARRDDFEENDEYLFIKSKLAEIARDKLEPTTRVASETNSSIKKIEKAKEEIIEIEQRINNGFIGREDVKKLQEKKRGI